VQEGLQSLVYELGPRRGEEQRLGPGHDVERRIMKQLADALGRLHAAGLAQQSDVQSARPKHFNESQRESRFARAIQPFDSYQPSTGHLGQGIWRAGRWV
jgi:hypothetical protein